MVVRSPLTRFTVADTVISLLKETPLELSIITLGGGVIHSSLENVWAVEPAYSRAAPEPHVKFVPPENLAVSCNDILVFTVPLLPKVFIPLPLSIKVLYAVG